MINGQTVGETLAYKSILLSTLHGLRPLTVPEAMDRITHRITHLPKFLTFRVAVGIVS